ncbi:MAG: hypothetical protein F4Y00_00750 [Bacteroidetes bacterium SB0662_bin_6]|nr:hypothetical protein [Bacteroidetes bacterium SB0668_bin_1]MYE03495.1 hypothetical protein [Bacteroidetes bacterium SB0662_bin_6]
MNRLTRREVAAQRKREQEAEKQEQEARERQKQEAVLAQSAKFAAESAVSYEEYEGVKEREGRFAEMWDTAHNRKWMLAFILRRIASSVEASFLAIAKSDAVKNAADNVVGALFGGYEGAGSMSQMGVQQADVQYRTAKIAAGNLYQLAREIEGLDVDLDVALMEEVKDAALRIRKEGFGQAWENISLLLAAADKLVSYAYGFDAESVAGLTAVEYRREVAFAKAWNEKCVRAGLENYKIDGKKHYRRLFHDAPQEQ